MKLVLSPPTAQGRFVKICTLTPIFDSGIDSGIDFGIVRKSATS